MHPSLGPDVMSCTYKPFPHVTPNLGNTVGLTLNNFQLTKQADSIATARSGPP